MKKAGLFGQTSLLALVSAVSLVAAGPAHAGGFYLQEQSVRALGRAFSGEAADTGPESLWWNPAAIAGASRGSAHFGASAILPRGDVRNTGTLIVRPGQAPAGVGGQQTSENPIDKGILPAGGVAAPITDKLAVGLAVTSPYSFTTDYDATSWTRYTADKSKLRTIDLQPTVAFAPTPWLGLGFGLNVEYSDAALSNALPNLSPLLPDGHQQLKGDGWDIGWSAGLQLRGERAVLGLSYKSSIEHELNGRVVTTGLLGPLAASNTTVRATATFRTPWQAMAGVRFRATDRLTLNGQVVRIGWSKFDAIRLGAPLDTEIPENYRSTWSYAAGVDYALTPALTLRAGVQRDQTPTRDGERDARVPDSDRWTFAVGGSYAVSPRFTIDAGASYVDFANASIDRQTAAYAGTAVQTPILVSGVVEGARAIVLGVGGRMSF
jgi:long-chain fatty acid transport protein